MKPRHPKRGRGRDGARRPLGRVIPVATIFCAVWLTVSFFCQIQGVPVGFLGKCLLALVTGLLGRASPLVPAALSVISASRRRRACALYLAAFLSLLAVFWSGSADGSLAASFRAGQALSGGGLLGAALASLLGALGGRAGPYLAALVLLLAYLFVFLGLSPARLLSPLRRLHPRKTKIQRKENAMFNFKKKKPIVIDDGGYYPVSDAGESFSQVRARLEREESAKAYIAEDDELIAYPAPSPAAPTEPSAAPTLEISRRPLDSDERVLPASEIFGREGLHAFAESEAFPISPIRAEPSPAVRAIDAPFARPTVPQPTPTYTAPTPAPQPTPTYTAPAPAPQPTPTYTAPATAPQPTPTYTAPAPAPQPTPTYTAPAPDARPIFEDVETAETLADELLGNEGVSLPLDTARISDAAIPPVTTVTIPHSTASGAIAEPTKDAVPYVYPPLSLLNPAATASSTNDEEIRRNSQNLLDTLESFNVKASIRHVSRGPRITRYELVPDKGVRIRAITNLQDDISMNLAAAGIRIEAPIPGLAAVGVEVPNSQSTAVCLRDMLDNEAFRSASSKTTVCVGADVTGKPVYGDIGKMPHALIAGATGMGKSVCINTILLSLLYKAHPDEVKLILVDPKKVEFAPYNGIPHLLVPVVIEPQKAAGALVWAVGEMERRFNMIEQTGVRDIKGYNRIAAANPEMGKPMPQIVIVIDELNDLMMSARDAVEDAICRIAQKARAAGIHLLIGTQRPSVDVITGVIKANIPSRMAFHVSSQVDSRTILDMTGAEKLLDKGDMLFFPVGAPKPIRVQGAFVTDDEVSAVTDFLKRSAAATYDDEVMANIEREAERCTPKDKRAERGDDEYDPDGGDAFAEPQFVAAVEIAIKLGQISTSKIQTKLRIGFQKASNYIEKMEELGIVGPPNGSKPRDVLISADQFLEMKARR